MMQTEMLVKDALMNTVVDIDPSRIHHHAHLRNDLHVDSMGAIMLLIRLEETIDGFYVDPETCCSADLETVSSITDYIDRQLTRKNQIVH